jgi:hypothetical protein
MKQAVETCCARGAEVANLVKMADGGDTRARSAGALSHFLWIQMQEVVGLCMENIVVSSSLPGKKSTHHAAMPHMKKKQRTWLFDSNPTFF